MKASITSNLASIRYIDVNTRKLINRIRNQYLFRFVSNEARKVFCCKC